MRRWKYKANSMEGRIRKTNIRQFRVTEGKNMQDEDETVENLWLRIFQLR